MTQTITPPESGISRLWWAAKHPPADPKTSLVGRTILITGPNAGLGFECATKFAALGASTLIFGVRSLAKGEEAKARIEQATKCKSNIIQLFQLDMSSFTSIENFAKEVNIKFPKIDTAVLNAGIAPPAYQLSPHGHEMSVQVNAISTAYLAILLLPTLNETSSTTGKPSHLEFVASHGHAGVNLDMFKGKESILDTVNDPKLFTWLTQYSISKLLEMWLIKEIASKTLSSKIIVTETCPGLCRSNLGREFNMPIRVANKLFQLVFARTAEEGSRTMVSAVTLGKEAHDGYWVNDQLAM